MCASPTVQHAPSTGNKKGNSSNLPTVPTTLDEVPTWLQAWSALSTDDAVRLTLASLTIQLQMALEDAAAEHARHAAALEEARQLELAQLEQLERQVYGEQLALLEDDATPPHGILRPGVLVIDTATTAAASWLQRQLEQLERSTYGEQLELIEADGTPAHGISRPGLGDCVLCGIGGAPWRSNGEHRHAGCVEGHQYERCNTRGGLGHRCDKLAGHSGDHHALTYSGWLTWAHGSCAASAPTDSQAVCCLPIGHEGTHLAVDSRTGGDLTWQQTAKVAR